MDEQLAEAYAEAVKAVTSINAAIDMLRKLKISTSLKEHDGRYYLDARAPLCRAVADLPHENET